MKIQLWSYNYDPEPTGIGPLSTVWARAMSERGHQVEVVAAHPHYPEPVWGRPVLPAGSNATESPSFASRCGQGAEAPLSDSARN